MQVHVATADLVTVPVDAIVNPGNSMGIMGGGTSGHIRRIGGDDYVTKPFSAAELPARIDALYRRIGGDVIQQDAMARAPIAVGAAIITGAGALPCKFIIHAPIMDEPGQRIPAENVRRAARAALIAADVKQFKVIAFSGMGTDQGDVPMEEAARAIVEEIRAHKRACPETIYLVDTDAEMVDTFEDALRNAVQNL